MHEITPITQHNIEIEQNSLTWNSKPLLRLTYKQFYKEIIACLSTAPGKVVELGSGVGGFKNFYPKCIATDLFPNPWIDQVESAYNLSFKDSSVSTIIMFDVFHHIEFPGTALKECYRALAPGGRVVIFEPYISLLGFFVYGLLHKEPVAFTKKIRWVIPENCVPDRSYYAAQGNATRIFGTFSPFHNEVSADWTVISHKKFSALSYILSGGFSGPSLYSEKFLPFFRSIEKILDTAPFLSATRTLIVLEKK